MIYLFEYDMPFSLFRNITPLITELKTFPGWAQCFDKTWLIATHDRIEVVEQKLQPHIQLGDKILLLPVGDYTGRLPQEIWDWIDNCRNAGF